MALCQELAAAKCRRLALEDICKAEEVTFSACGVPLDQVQVFQYLGQMISETDLDWPNLYQNLAKARKCCWGMLTRVL
jgi:hypothetical protein